MRWHNPSPFQNEKTLCVATCCFSAPNTPFKEYPVIIQGIISAWLQSLHHASSTFLQRVQKGGLLNRQPCAGWGTRDVDMGPAAKPAPTTDRPWPSYGQHKNVIFFALPWLWNQNLHRLVCSEGLLLALVPRPTWGLAGRSRNSTSFRCPLTLSLAHPHHPAPWEGHLLACSS